MLDSPFSLSFCCSVTTVILMFLVSFNFCVQTLKDVSAAWQVWKNKTLSYFFSTYMHPNHKFKMRNSIICNGFNHWLLCCRTGDISWLIDKGSHWLHLRISLKDRPKVHWTPSYGHFGAETLSSYRPSFTETPWKRLRLSEARSRKDDTTVWFGDKLNHTRIEHTESPCRQVFLLTKQYFSLCAAASCIYLYFLFIRSQRRAWAFVLYQYYCT